MSIAKERICLYSSLHCGRSSSREIITDAAALGVGGVELMNFCDELRQPDRAAARQLGAYARSLGLAIPCFSLAADVYADPAGMTDYVLRYAEICAELEIPYLHHTVAISISAFDLTEEQRRERFDRCAEHVLRIGERARALGVRTLIEDQGFVFNGVESCLSLCRLSGGEIRLVADIGNILFVDETPADFIRTAGDLICHAHIKDYSRQSTPHEGCTSYRTRGGQYIADTELGCGVVDLPAVKAAFDSIGYTGMYAMEFTPRTPGELDRALGRWME